MRGRLSQSDGLLGFWHESRHFIDCIKDGRQPSSNFADAVEAMVRVERMRAARPG